jgi:hypothetical protein
MSQKHLTLSLWRDVLEGNSGIGSNAVQFSIIWFWAVHMDVVFPPLLKVFAYGLSFEHKVKRRAKLEHSFPIEAIEIVSRACCSTSFPNRFGNNPRNSEDLSAFVTRCGPTSDWTNVLTGMSVIVSVDYYWSFGGFTVRHEKGTWRIDKRRPVFKQKATRRIIFPSLHDLGPTGKKLQISQCWPKALTDYHMLILANIAVSTSLRSSCGRRDAGFQSIDWTGNVRCGRRICSDHFGQSNIEEA